MLRKILALLLLPFSLLFSLTPRIEEMPAEPTAYYEEEPVMNGQKKCDKIEGQNFTFYIERPDCENLNTVYASAFGMSEELGDNTKPFCDALSYCRENPGTKLVIEEGIYRFPESGKIVMDGLDTCLIDGAGAEFIFEKPGTFIGIRACNCLEINGLSIDVDRVSNPVDDVLRIRNANKRTHTLDFVFFEKEDVDENMIFSAITQCDPDTLTFGAKNSSKENYIYMNPDIIRKVEKTAPNVLTVTHDGAFDNFADGDTFILRHHVYDGTVFSVYGKTENLTFDGVKVYGSYGSGFAPSDLSSHYQIINSFIGVDPQDKTGAHASLGADAIHIANTAGFFNLENCDISGQGDDALNIHDGLGYVGSVNGNTVKIFCSAGRLNTGESLAFRDTGFNETGFSAVITGVTAGSGTEKTVTFDRDVSANVKAGYTAYNTCVESGYYVLRGNYMHESRARAMLLQSDNGLCENNRFYKIQGQAIKIVMDIIPSLWQEGTGVDNLIIRNNEFVACDYSGWGEQITVDTNIDGRTADTTVFSNIEITGNSFSDFDTKLMNVMNVNGLTVAENKIDASGKENFIKMNDYCENVVIDNEYTGKFADSAAIVRGNFRDFVKQNSSGKEC